MPHKKKKKKVKQRVFVEGPKVSDPNVVRKLDADREKVQEEIEETKYRQSRRSGGYGLDDYSDPAASIAALMTLKHMAKQRIQKKIIENKERSEDEIERTEEA